MTKRYNVHSPINHDGEQYHPNTENNVIELTDKQAKPLLDESVIGLINEIDGSEVPGTIEQTKPENEAAVLHAIRRVIEGLDVTDKTKWTKANKPDANVLTELLGWSVSAAERDAATLLPKSTLDL